MDKKITVVGSGYVGMSLAVLLAQKNEVLVHDIDKTKVDLINNGRSTINEETIIEYMDSSDLNISATLSKKSAYFDADYIIIATPTDYSASFKGFNTQSIESVLTDCMPLNEKASIIIKSTVPIGFTYKQNIKFSSERILFSPEFLREGHSLDDNLYPSRIIVGGSETMSRDFANLLKEVSLDKDVSSMFMSSSEAEAVKLFSNSYLAMRVAFFNELDTFAFSNQLNVENIIQGVSKDSRIGEGYNNPSFGYGGYCLPKDTKQLLSSYNEIPQKMVSSIVESNETRKKFISDSILSLNPKTVGIYRLLMKEGSTNWRSSSILDIITDLKDAGKEIIVYEPLLEENDEFIITKDLDNFKQKCDLIVTNRLSSDLDDVPDKIFTRDVFRNN